MQTMTKIKVMALGAAAYLAPLVSAETTISIPYINITPITQTITDVFTLLTTIVGTNLPPFISAFAGILIQLAVLGLVISMVGLPIVLVGYLIGHLKGMKIGGHKL